MDNHKRERRWNEVMFSAGVTILVFIAGAAVALYSTQLTILSNEEIAHAENTISEDDAEIAKKLANGIEEIAQNGVAAEYAAIDRAIDKTEKSLAETEKSLAETKESLTSVRQESEKQKVTNRHQAEKIRRLEESANRERSERVVASAHLDKTVDAIDRKTAQNAIELRDSFDSKLEALETQADDFKVKLAQAISKRNEPATTEAQAQSNSVNTKSPPDVPETLFDVDRTFTDRGSAVHFVWQSKTPLPLDDGKYPFRVILSTAGGQPHTTAFSPVDNGYYGEDFVGPGSIVSFSSDTKVRRGQSDEQFHTCTINGEFLNAKSATGDLFGAIEILAKGSDFRDENAKVLVRSKRDHLFLSRDEYRKYMAGRKNRRNKNGGLFRGVLSR